MRIPSRMAAIGAGALALAFALAFGAAPATAHAGTPEYTNLDAASAAARGGGLWLSVDAKADIPRFPDAYIDSVPVFGYAWADLDTGKAVVVTIHPNVPKDAHKQPDTWHLHFVTLASGTAASNFCIASLAGVNGGIQIGGDRLAVKVPANRVDIGAAALDVAASFEVHPDSGCAATGLGVVLLHTAGL